MTKILELFNGNLGRLAEGPETGAPEPDTAADRTTHFFS
jgi:hypothetical protein